MTVPLMVVGCGGIAPFHLDALVKDPRAELVALVDPNPAAADAARAKYAPRALTGTDIADVSRRSGAAAAVVLSPTHLHYEHVRLIRGLGLDVLCEKPLAETRERIAQLVKEAETGPRLSIAYQRRSWAVYRTMRREVLSGKWGPLQAVTSLATERWIQVYRGTWRELPEFNPGGFVGDAGSHKVDMLFYTTGLAPESIRAVSSRRGYGVDIVTNAIGKLTGGVDLTMISIGDAQHYREELFLHCRDADFILRDNTLLIARENRIEPFAPLEPQSTPVSSFLDMLVDGSPNIAPAEIAIPVWDFTQMLLAAGRSEA